MRKETSKRNAKATTAAKMRSVKPVPVVAPTKQCSGGWSVSLYIYWFIILFFIAATFYILGRSHGALTHRTPANNVEITEEALLQAMDFYESGKQKLIAGNIDEAIIDLTAAIEADEQSVDAYIMRGEAYMQSGDYRNAVADFDAAIAIDDHSAVAYYDRALLNTRLEDYNAALNDINNALAAVATAPSEILQMRDLYAKRGQLNLWLKNWTGAIADYTNSLARPDGMVTPTVYAERAEAYTAVGNFADAITDYTSAVRVISEQIQGATTSAERERLSSLAMSYFEKSAALNLNLGNVEGALSDLESARTIAVALNDAETVDRITALISEMNQ